MNLLEDIKEIYKSHKNKPSKNCYKHNSIQRDIVKLAEKYNCAGKEEVVADYANRRGRCDVVWYKNDNPVLAIEIDSHYRKKSIEKLLKFDCKKLWVLYATNKYSLKFIGDIDKNGEIKILCLE